MEQELLYKLQKYITKLQEGNINGNENGNIELYKSKVNFYINELIGGVITRKGAIK